MTTDPAVERALRRIRREVRELVARRYREGRPELIRAEIARLVADSGLRTEAQRALLRELRQIGSAVREELGARFAAERLPERPITPQIDAVLRRSLSELAASEVELERRAAEAVDEAVREGRGAREAARRAVEAVGGRAHAVRTAVETGKAAFDRGLRVEHATAAGIQRFRYAGPPPERPFCRRHYGRVFTLAELDRLSNGHGLPVRTYLGGYNCRHRLDPVFDDEEGLGRADLEAARSGEVRFADRDFRQDARKHAEKFGLSPDAYAAEAARVAESAERVLVKAHKGRSQFWLFGERGVVVMDPDGTLRGYFFHADPGRTFEEMQKKPPWTPLID